MGLHEDPVDVDDLDLAVPAVDAIDDHDAGHAEIDDQAGVPGVDGGHVPDAGDPIGISLDLAECLIDRMAQPNGEPRPSLFGLGAEPEAVSGPDRRPARTRRARRRPAVPYRDPRGH